MEGNWKASSLPSTPKGLPTMLCLGMGRFFQLILSGKLVLFNVKGLMDIREQYECVSSSDYIYIMECLESDEYRKVWIRCVTYCYHTLPGDEPSHLRPKITFFFDSQSLMALSPLLLTNPPFSSVTTDGLTWFSLTSVESHLWMHKPSELKIRMGHLDEDNYAYRVHLCFIFQCFSTDNYGTFSHSDNLPECCTVRILAATWQTHKTDSSYYF